MEDIIKVDDQLIADKLAEPEWPWIIALAYLGEDRAQNAVATVIWWLDYYKDAGLIDVATGMALKHLNKALVGDASESDWSVIKEIERPIIQAIRAGEIVSFGSKKPKPDIVLKPLKRLLWAGGEIIMNETSDLKPAGERGSDCPTFARQNSTRAYDVHVSASDIRKLVDRQTPIAQRSIERISSPPTKNQPTKRHGHLFTFFLRVMTDDIRDGKRFKAQANYVRWLKRDRPHEKPFARTAFEGMLEHYKDGWRIKDNEWVLESLEFVAADVAGMSNF